MKRTDFKAGIKICFIFAFLWFSSWQVHAKEVYTVGVENVDFYPLYSFDQKTQHQGFGYEVLELFATQQRYQFIYKAYPPKRLLKYFLDKDIDFRFPDNPRWKKTKREEYTIHYSRPAIFPITSIVVNASNKDMTLENFKIIGTPRGFTPWMFARQIASGQITHVESQSNDSIIKMVLAGRVDGALMELNRMHYYLNKQGIPHALVPAENIFKPMKGEFRLSSIKYPGIIEKFDLFLEAQKEHIEKLRIKYKISP